MEKLGSYFYEIIGKNKVRLAVYRCMCGRSTICRPYEVSSKGTVSCGCYNKKKSVTHNMHTTKTYSVWCSMKSRCLSKTHHAYASYGGRGITICDEWLDFVNFHNDMGNKPDGMSLDRIDNEKGYFKDNCRWTTMKEQERNRSNNRYITVGGERKCLAYWLEKFGVNRRLFYTKVNSGLSELEALGVL